MITAPSMIGAVLTASRRNRPVLRAGGGRGRGYPDGKASGERVGFCPD